MTRTELEHVIRPVAAITNENELIVIGSQAILGQYPNAPKKLLVSDEADLTTAAELPAHGKRAASCGSGSRKARVHFSACSSATSVRSTSSSVL